MCIKLVNFGSVSYTKGHTIVYSFARYWCAHRCRKFGKIGGGQTVPAQPPTSDNMMKYTIGNVITGVQGARRRSPRKLQDFHKILIKLWYFGDHLPRPVLIELCNCFPQFAVKIYHFTACFFFKWRDDVTDYTPRQRRV